MKLSSGAKARIPGREAMHKVPVLRGVVRLGESLAVLPAVRRETGGPVLPHEDPRLLGGDRGQRRGHARGARHGRRHPLLSELAAAGISLAPVLLALRDSRLSQLSRRRAQERRRLRDTASTPAEADKEHERCGSNLVAPMLVTNLAANLLLRAAGKERKPLATFVAGLVSIGTAMELFSWMARHQDHPLAKTMRLPGIEMQRLFTTSEPTEEQLDVARRGAARAAAAGGRGGRPR